MSVPLYVICCFSLVAFNILPVLNFCQFDYSVFLVCSSLGLTFLGLCFQDLVDYFLSMFRNSSAIISSSIFSGPFSLSPPETSIMHMLVHLMFSQRSLRLFTFHSFSILCSVAVISTILSSGSFTNSLPQLFCF